MNMREAFEEWHDKFYGPQDPYNPIRSTAYDSCNVGLGYDDPIVQAQFCAFRGAQEQLMDLLKEVRYHLDLHATEYGHPGQYNLIDQLTDRINLIKDK